MTTLAGSSMSASGASSAFKPDLCMSRIIHPSVLIGAAAAGSLLRSGRSNHAARGLSPGGRTAANGGARSPAPRFDGHTRQKPVPLRLPLSLLEDIRIAAVSATRLGSSQSRRDLPETGGPPSARGSGRLRPGHHPAEFAPASRPAEIPSRPPRIASISSRNSVRVSSLIIAARRAPPLSPGNRSLSLTAWSSNVERSSLRMFGSDYVPHRPGLPAGLSPAGIQPIDNNDSAMR
jgi:hypothetical protein